jgi:hypothetical protein
MSSIRNEAALLLFCVGNSAQEYLFFSRSRSWMDASLRPWIFEPSATENIERTCIKGVHGPYFLVVILVRDDMKRQATPLLTERTNL